MLKIEDVKVGDELECIDLKSMAKKWENASDLWRKAKIDVFKVSSINKELAVVYFQDNKFYLEEHEFQYFKKKEQLQYTFDDLIDLAKKAVRDGVVFNFTFATEMSGSDLLKLNHIDGGNSLYTSHNLEDGVKYIQSLYKETFVIESHEDIRRIKNDANITLSNGNRIEQAVHENRGDYIVFNDSSDDVYTFNFMVLKGATVEQERGRDDRS